MGDEFDVKRLQKERRPSGKEAVAATMLIAFRQSACARVRTHEGTCNLTVQKQSARGL